MSDMYLIVKVMVLRAEGSGYRQSMVCYVFEAFHYVNISC